MHDGHAQRRRRHGERRLGTVVDDHHLEEFPRPSLPFEGGQRAFQLGPLLVVRNHDAHRGAWPKQVGRRQRHAMPLVVAHARRWRIHAVFADLCRKRSPPPHYDTSAHGASCAKGPRGFRERTSRWQEIEAQSATRWRSSAGTLGAARASICCGSATRPSEGPLRASSGIPLAWTTKSKSAPRPSALSASPCRRRARPSNAQAARSTWPRCARALRTGCQRRPADLPPGTDSTGHRETTPGSPTLGRNCCWWLNNAEFDMDAIRKRDVLAAQRSRPCRSTAGRLSANV